jgi:hypothetical protein
MALLILETILAQVGIQ